MADGMIGSSFGTRFLQNLAPVIQGAGASIGSTGDLTQLGPNVQRFQALAGQQQLRDLQTQAAQQRLADAERARQQEAATAEAFRALPPGIFGGGDRGAAIRAAGVANPALGQKLLVQASKPQTTADTALVRNLKAGGLTPGTPEFQEAVLKGATKPLVTVQGPGQKKFTDKLFELTAKRFEKVTNDAASASGDLANFAILKETLGDPNVYTGPGGVAINRLKGVAQLIPGLNIQGVADASVADRVSKRLAINLQKELPLGKLTDDDRKFLQSLPPGLGIDPEANVRLIELGELSANRKIERKQIMEQGINEDGSFDRRETEKRLSALDRRYVQNVRSRIKDLRARAKQAGPRSPFAGLPPIGEMTFRQTDQLIKKRNDLTTEQIEAIVARRKELSGG